MLRVAKWQSDPRTESAGCGMPNKASQSTCSSKEEHPFRAHALEASRTALICFERAYRSKETRKTEYSEALSSRMAHRVSFFYWLFATRYSLLVSHHLPILAHFARAPIDAVGRAHDGLVAAEAAGAGHDLVA